MNTSDLTQILPGLFSEFVYGSPDPSAPTYMLNRGDAGLLASLEKVSASAASATPTGGASIAAHVDHLCYGFSLLNRWAAGEVAPWKNADWTQSWHKPPVTDASWRALRDELRRETDAWREALRLPREVDIRVVSWIVGSVAHLGYHLGAIRQIDRAARGPTAEDERPSQT
jgi:hypothetical protein